MKINVLFWSIAVLLLHTATAKITILSHTSQNDTFPDQIAAFGNRLRNENAELTGLLVPVESPLFVAVDDGSVLPAVKDLPLGLGCTPVQVPPLLQNKTSIALIQRGSCSFTDKVRNMQRSGAIGVIVGNNEALNYLLTMFGTGDLSDIDVLATFVLQGVYRELHYLCSTMPLGDFVAVRIELSEMQRWPVVDVVVVSVFTPLLVSVLIYAVWRLRRRRMLLGATDMVFGEMYDQGHGLLTQDELSEIPIKSFDAQIREGCECETCAICLDDMEDEDQIDL